MNTMSTATLYTYALEPGDATRWRFSFYDNAEIARGVDSSIKAGMLIPGAGSGYVTLIIQMPSGSGSYEFRKDSIRHLHSPFIHYAVGKLKCGIYTVAAIMLAMRVLIDNPVDLDGAAEAMLDAPRLLKGELDHADLEG